MARTNHSFGLRFPAEFETQRAVWLGWPVSDAKRGLSTIDVYLQLIRILAPHVTVKIATQNEAESHRVASMLTSHSISMKNVDLVCIPHDDIWFRDMGPRFLTDGQGRMAVQKFAFNAWGYEAIDSPDILLDQQVPDRVAEMYDLELLASELINEGGDLEFNGQGTLITVEAVELQRNFGKTRDEIEAELKAVFDLDNVIWLKKGVYDDDLPFDGTLPGPDGLKDVLTCLATGGHIDEHCRFVSADTVLVAEVSEEEAEKDPIADVTRRRLEENVEILQKATDQDGKPLVIRRIPVPDSLFSTMRSGDDVYDYYREKYDSGFVYPIGEEIKVIAAASYSNFLITNGVVLGAEYWRPGLPDSIRHKDQLARSVLEDLFPDRTVHTIDVRALNFGGGGIHCITQQEPWASAKEELSK